MRHFHYDPFTTLGGKENCTVGALRSQVPGRDVSTRSQLRDRIDKRGTRSVDLLAASKSS
jgi:hypothetical protein